MSRRGQKRKKREKRGNVDFSEISRDLEKRKEGRSYINVNIEAKICSRHDKHDGECKMDKAFDRCEYRLSVLDYETISRADSCEIACHNIVRIRDLNNKKKGKKLKCNVSRVARTNYYFVVQSFDKFLQII